jgi:hypothetical protein
MKRQTPISDRRGGGRIIRPGVRIKKPTETIWGLAPKALDRNPKRQARDAIARRKKLKK